MKSFLEVTKPKTDPGLYVCAKFCQASNEALKKVQDTLGMTNPVVASKLHTTIVYSRKTIDLPPVINLNESARLVDFEKWDTKYGSTVVGILESDYLHERFKEAMANGATYDYDDYKPHVTLSYDSGISVLDMKGKLTLPIELNIVEEHFESLDLDKKLEDITEHCSSW